MAASAAVHLAERGYSVDLATSAARSDDEPDVALADGPVGAVLGELALVQLAARVDDLSEGLPSLTRAGSFPVVALSGAPDVETVRWMLSQRAPASPAVALLVGPAAPVTRPDGSIDDDPALDAFARAGWRAARVSARLTPDSAWLALLGVAEPDLPDWALARTESHA